MPLLQAYVVSPTQLDSSPAETRHTLRLKLACGRESTYIPLLLLITGGWLTRWTRNSLAEFTTIIVVTCFPVMPRFAEIIHGKTSHSRDTESHPSYQASRSISGTGGTSLSSRLPDGSDTWTKRGDTMTAPKNAYIPLGENAYQKAYKAYGSPEHGGIQRTVSIELTSNT